MMNLKQKIKSDRAAVMSTEMLILIVLAVFATLIIFKSIMKPLQESAEGIGNSIKDMNTQ